MRLDRTRMLKMCQMKNNIYQEKRLLHVKGDPLAHVLVIVEDRFRPLGFRVVEYLAFWILFKFRPERAEKITLGMNQLRADRWIEYLQSDSRMPGIIKLILAGESLNESANATRWFLDKCKFKKTDGNSISAFYTGRQNAYYDRLVKDGLEFANSIRSSAKSH